MPTLRSALPRCGRDALKSTVDESDFLKNKVATGGRVNVARAISLLNTGDPDLEAPRYRSERRRWGVVGCGGVW